MRLTGPMPLGPVSIGPVYIAAEEEKARYVELKRNLALLEVTHCLCSDTH